MSRDTVSWTPYYMHGCYQTPWGVRIDGENMGRLIINLLGTCKKLKKFIYTTPDNGEPLERKIIPASLIDDEKLWTFNKNEIAVLSNVLEDGFVPKNND